VFFNCSGSGSGILSTMYTPFSVTSYGEDSAAMYLELEVANEGAEVLRERVIPNAAVTCLPVLMDNANNVASLVDVLNIILCGAFVYLSPERKMRDEKEICTDCSAAISVCDAGMYGR